MERDVERLVADGYDRVADAYAALEDAGPWPRRRRLRALLALLPAGSRVLDLGCGAGPALREVVDAGHAALGVDISAEQLARARGAVPEAELRHGSALDLDLPVGSLDAVVAFYVIEHLPRERHGELLAAIARWLRPGGLLLFTVEVGDQPGFVGSWLGVPMFFSCFGRSGTERLVGDAGFQILSADEESQLEGPLEVPYLWVLARRP